MRALRSLETSVFQKAEGDTIVFIDSDLVVLNDFLQYHADALSKAYAQGNERVFTYGRVVNTCNFENPTAEPFKVTDYSRAFFATGNVAIAKRWLLEAGLFDAQFTQYGWEDLELGVRLKKQRPIADQMSGGSWLSLASSIFNRGVA